MTIITSIIIITIAILSLIMFSVFMNIERECIEELDMVNVMNGLKFLMIGVISLYLSEVYNFNIIFSILGVCVTDYFLGKFIYTLIRMSVPEKK